MKVQIEIRDEALWRRVRMAVLESGTTTGDWVEGLIRGKLNGGGSSEPTKASSILGVGDNRVLAGKPVTAEPKAKAKPEAEQRVQLPRPEPRPAFKVIRGLRFGQPEYGMLRANSVICVGCKQFCSGEEGWSKNGKDFLCAVCWDKIEEKPELKVTCKT